METIEDKINLFHKKIEYLKATKEGIRQKINKSYGREEISISDTFNSYIQKLEEQPFYVKKIIDGPIKSVKISNVTSIGRYAFYKCINLTEASFPNVVSVDIYAFSECTNLISVYLPKTTFINTGSFYNCAELRDIYIGTNTSTVCELGQSVFYGCQNLTNIYVPAKLVDSYKSHPNWKFLAGRIKGL